jgi:hypothetical protein
VRRELCGGPFDGAIMRTDDDTCVVRYGVGSNGIFVIPNWEHDYNCPLHEASYVVRPGDATKMDFVRDRQKPVTAEAT